MSSLLGFSLSPFGDTQRSEEFGLLLPHAYWCIFPALRAAPGFEVPVNICWFRCSGMRTYPCCRWIIDFRHGETEAWPRTNEGKALLKTRALSKINLNGNLKPENQLLFKWIILKIRFLVLENISQGCLHIFSRNNCVLAEMLQHCSLSHFPIPLN